MLTLNSYKKFLLNKSFKNKYNILTSKFPRFLWVFRNKNQKMDINLPLKHYVLEHLDQLWSPEQ